MKMQKIIQKPWYTIEIEHRKKPFEPISGGKKNIDKYLKQLGIEYNIQKDLVKEVNIKIEAVNECNKGIYALMLDNKIIYVGKTSRRFIDRANQHKMKIRFKSEQSKLYKYLLDKDCTNLKMIALVEIQELNYTKKNKITNNEIDMMELGFIYHYKPICNVEGVVIPYKIIIIRINIIKSIYYIIILDF